MKLKPGIESLDTDNVNVSHTSPLREFAILLVSAFAVLALVYVLLGLLIDRAVDWIDPATEKAVFGQLSSALDDGTPPTNAEASLQDRRSCSAPTPVSMRCLHRLQWPGRRGSHASASPTPIASHWRPCSVTTSMSVGPMRSSAR